MRRTIFWVSIVFAVGATGAAASDAEGTFDSPWELPDSIIVTANRFGLSSRQSVWPVSVVVLENIGAQSSLDAALEGESGADIRNSSGDGSIATLSNWGVFNRHMLLLYNGRVVKDYSLGGFNLSDFSIEEFERVEMLKGPQSAFYGSDAVGGVVNLISKSSLIDRIDITTKYGSLGYRHHHVDLARKVGAVGVGAFAEFASTDNRRANAGMKHTILGVRSDCLSDNNRHRLSFSARYFDDSLGVPGPVPDLRWVPIYGNEESSSLTARQEDENYSFDAQYRFFHEGIGQFQLDLFWEKKNLHYNSLYNYPSYYPIIDTLVDPPDTSQNVDSVDVHATSIYNKRSSGVNARIMKRMEALSLAGGIDWLSGSLAATSYDSSIGTNIEGPYAPFAYEFTTFNFWSGRQNQFDVWGNVELKTDKLSKRGWPFRFDLSGRLQLVRNRQTQPSYNVGLIYSPAPFLRFKLGYAYAYRLPTIAEQFADDVFTAGNTDLSPETARTLQATLAISPPGETMSTELTVFHQKIDSLIQYRYDAVLFRSIPRNVEQFKSTGLDVSLRLKAGRNLSLQWNGVLQKAEQSIENGQNLVEAYYVPDIKWRADLDGSFTRLSGNVNVTYTSSRTVTLFDGSRKEIGKVYELGMHIGMRVTDHIDLSFVGYDLTDEHCPDQFGFTAGDGDYPGLGRRFILEARLSLL
jgi:outer membrane cobalamin receptor